MIRLILSIWYKKERKRKMPNQMDLQISYNYVKEPPQVTIIVSGSKGKVEEKIILVKIVFGKYRIDINQPCIQTGISYVATLTFYDVPEEMIDVLIGQCR